MAVVDNRVVGYCGHSVSKV